MTYQDLIPLNEGRGINPGDTRATSAIPRLATPLNEGGASTPATPEGELVMTYQDLIPLNEGRGINPGDTTTHTP